MSSKRHFTQDVDKARQKRYRELDNEGKVQQAIWEMIRGFKEQGLDIGPKAEELLNQRSTVKERMPRK